MNERCSKEDEMSETERKQGRKYIRFHLKDGQPLLTFPLHVQTLQYFSAPET